MAELTSIGQWWLHSWWHRWYVRRHVPAFLRACPEPIRGAVLEVGAGRGLTSEQILETFPPVELTAIDMDQAAIEHFNQLQGKYGQRLHVKTADIFHLPFDRASFDIAIALYVMHHLDDVPKALQQMLRVLKPGGLLGLADEDIHHRLSLHHSDTDNHPRRSQIEKILRDEECEILVAQGDMPYTIWARKAYPVAATTISR
jgi:ubiquinone/menaquinone biosynthesis C-methylase UbiE